MKLNLGLCYLKGVSAEYSQDIGEALEWLLRY